MALRIEGGIDEYLLVRWNEERPFADSELERVSEAMAPQVLERALDSCAELAFGNLVRAVPGTDSEPILHARDGAEAARAGSCGSSFELYRRSWKLVSSQRVARPRAPARSASPAAPAGEPRSYIAVAVESVEGRALRGLRVEIVTSDGACRVAFTDAMGAVYLTGIPSGACKVCLPTLDMSTWRGSGPSLARKEAGRTHVVAAGECVPQLAVASGFGDAWTKVWQHPRNAELRAMRKDPQVLLAGDRIFIPGVDVGAVERATDAVHRIVVSATAVEVQLALTFTDEDGEPLREAYVVHYQHEGSSQTRTGVLDAAGELREMVPATLMSARVTLRESQRVYDVALGELSPVQQADGAPIVRGAVERLRALGFGRRDHTADVTAAVEVFQRRVMRRDAATGDLDAETCGKLVALFGA